LAKSIDFWDVITSRSWCSVFQWKFNQWKLDLGYGGWV